MNVFDTLKQLISQKQDSGTEKPRVDVFIKTVGEDGLTVYDAPRLSPDFIEKFLENQLHLIKNGVSYYTGTVYLRSPEGDLTLFSSVGSDGYLLDTAEIENGCGPIGWCFKYGKPVSIAPLKERTRTLFHYKYNPPVQSLIACPLWIGRKVVGVISLERLEPNGFNDTEFQVLHNYAAGISQFLEARHQVLHHTDSSRDILRLKSFLDDFIDAEDAGTLVSDFLGRVRNILPFTRAGIFLEQGGCWFQIGLHGYEDIFSHSIVLPAHLKLIEMAGHSGEVLRFDNDLKSHYQGPLSRTGNVRHLEESGLLLPVRVNHTGFCMILTSSEPFFFESGDNDWLVPLLVSLGKTYLRLVRNISLEREITSRSEIIETVSALNTAYDLPGLFDVLERRAGLWDGILGFTIFVPSENGSFDLLFHTEHISPELVSPSRQDTAGFLKKVFSLKTPLETDWFQNPVIGMPILGSHQNTGIILFEVSLGTQTAGILEFLKKISPDISATFARAHKTEILKHRSSTDPLTGLYNREFFAGQLQLEINRYNRNETPFSVVMIDLDNFKWINDSYGHSMGDMILIQVSGAMSATLRDMDILARYGGEEFIAILPETSLDKALTIAERLKSRIASLKPCDIPVTVSVGVVEYNKTDTAASIIEQADRAMYESKSSGKNTVSAGFTQY